MKKRLLVVAAAVGVLTLSYFLLTRSAIIRTLAMSALSDATGTTATCDSVVASASGEIVIEGLKLETSNASGPASTIVQAERIRIQASLFSLLTDTPDIRAVEVQSPLVRISQSIKTERLNLPKLPESSDGPRKITADQLPRIDITNGVIELGEHDVADAPDGYRLLKRIDVDGHVGAPTGDDGETLLTIQNIQSAGGALEIRGRVTRDALAVRVGDLDLAKIDIDSLPKPLRETIESLKLTGSITDTEFTYAFDGTFSAAANLVQGGATLPREVQPTDDDRGGFVPPPAELAGRKLRLSNMNGSVELKDGRWTGSLKAVAEDLPCELYVDWNGTTTDAPFAARLIIPPLKVIKKPFIIEFSDPVAKLRYGQFGDPTGMVSGEIAFTREAPGDDSPVKVRGAIDLEDASTAFHKFPYRFSNLKGRVTFTDEAVTIERLEGDSPSGAKVSASGTLIPPDNPVADIRVKVTNLKTDDALLEAMRTRGRIMEELFSRRAYRALIDAGLVRAPGTRGDAPVFEPGGVANLEVLVTREPLASGEGDWHDTVTVNFDKVGILPDDFPYPMIGHDITLVKHDYDAVISGGSYEGLAGGRAEITAKADLLKIDDQDAEFIPDVKLIAAGLPIDERLIRALPPGRETLGDGRTIPELVRGFGFSGVIAGRVDLGMDQSDSLRYDVDLEFRDIDAEPSGTRLPGVVLRDITGKLNISQSRLETSFRTDVIKADTGMLPFTPAGNVKVDASFDFTRLDKPSQLAVSVDAERLELSTPLEDAIAVISPEAAAEIESLRTQEQPSGTCDLELSLTRTGGRAPAINARATNAVAQFNLFGARIGVNMSQGSASMIRDESTLIYDFKDCRTSIADITKFGVVNGGSWTLAGPLTVNGTPNGALEATVDNGRLESPSLLALIRNASPKAADTIASFSPVGQFDGHARIEGSQLLGTIEPTTAAVTLNGGRAVFETCTGSIGFTNDGASFTDLRLNAKDWNVNLSGGVGVEPSGDVRRDLVINLQAASLNPELKGVVPIELRETLTAIDLNIDGPLRIRDMHLNWLSPAQGADTLRTRASIDFEQARVDVGAAITECSGTLETSYERMGESPSVFSINAANVVAKAAGLNITNASAMITSGEQFGRPGTMIVQSMSADSHGGRLTGRASLEPADARRKRRFDAELQFADLRFADVLKDFRSVSGEQQGATPDAARGLLDANMSITGDAGDIASRRGRGVVTVSEGQVLSVPLLVSLVRVSNLQLPRSETMNYASVEFFIEGAGVNVEQLAVESSSVGIYGFGTATWPGMELDLRFRTRARDRIPVVTDVIEGIRGEMVTGIVRGNAANPDIRVTALSGASKLIDRVLGRDPDEQEKRLEQIERSREDAAVRERERNEPTAPK